MSTETQTPLSSEQLTTMLLSMLTESYHAGRRAGLATAEIIAEQNGQWIVAEQIRRCREHGRQESAALRILKESKP